MKKLIILIILGFSVSCFAQDTLKSYTKIINYGKPSRETWKCFVMQNGNKIDTVCVKIPTGQSHKDTDIDTTMQALKSKIEADYKNDLKQLQELQTKIIKEESYLEILNYLIEEKKK